MKNLLITHTDLDGISPIILLNLSKEKFEYKSIEIETVDETFNLLFDTKEIYDYDQIYITDLTLTNHVYDLLNNSNLKVLVFDHHVSHLFANNYDYVTVKPEINGIKTCGTELFYLYLLEKYPDIYNKPIIKDYVNLVREKDNYEMTSEKPKEVEMLMTVYGRPTFIKSFTRRLKKDKPELTFTAFERRYLDITAEARRRYLYVKELSMKIYLIDNKKFGVVFAEKYQDDIGNSMSTKHPELDGIIIINASNGISYRTTREDVDLANFASHYGGGGHLKASGSTITDDDRDAFIKRIFNDAKELKEES